MTGRVIECTSDSGMSSGLVAALTLIDTSGRAHPLVGYEHDHERNLTAAFDAMKQPHCFGYAGGQRMVRHTSPRGVSFYYSYQRHDDGVWRVDHAWGESGLFDYRFVYDVERYETRITDSLGHTTLLQGNERGIPVARIEPPGGVWSYRYDAQGRTSVETDPVGRTAVWDYDAYGNLLAQTLPDQRTARAVYNTDHRLVSMTDPGGRRWCYRWDDCDNLVEQTTPTEAVLHFAYDRHGQLVEYTGPLGSVTRFEYDRDGNPEAVINALGHRTSYMHDARANLIQTVNALAQVSRHEYDRNGNLTRSIGPGGWEVHCGYDADGNLVRYRDANGEVTRLEYTALGQILRRLTPDGNTVEYRYDTEEQLVGVANERGELYQLKRDGLGRIVEEVDYWGQTRRYEYGPLGELRRSVDPLGQAIDYDTDVFGRIVKKRVPDPRQPDGFRIETFGYDRAGNLTIVQNPDSRVELVYDAAGRVIEERQGQDFVITHAYDAAGNRTERRTRLQMEGETETVGHTVSYAYNALDEACIIQIDDAVPVTLERDALRQIFVERLGSKLRRKLSYTSEGLLAQQTLLTGTGALFASEYRYDANGELLEKSDSRLGTERFEYDPVGKLTGHLDPAGKLHRFLFDPAGDLLKTRVRYPGLRAGVFGQGATQTDTWVREGEYDGCYYAFDRAGNLVRKQDAQQDLMLRWDGDGLLIETVAVRPRPTTALAPSAGMAVHGYGRTLRIHTRYAYDAFHRRTEKVTQVQHNIAASVMPVAWPGSPPGRTSLARTSRFLWEGDALVGEVSWGNREVGGLLSEVEGSGETEQPRVSGHASGQNEVPSGVRADETGCYGEIREWVYYPGTFRPLAGMQRALIEDKPRSATGGTPLDSTPKPSALHYFHTDPNGVPTRITDPIGAVVWEAGYAAWGNINRGSAQPELRQSLRFQGQFHDEESGLYYNRYRYYDPNSAIFISQDPIRLLGGVNLYQFVPNVLTWSDPLGLKNRSHRVGDFGEEQVKIRLLEQYGKYVSVFSVQNKNNHGLDLVGLRFDGKFDFFEVKTNSTGELGNLSERQKHDLNFINTVLGSDVNGGGYNLHGHSADDILANIGDTYLVHVFIKTDEETKRWFVSFCAFLNWEDKDLDFS